MLIARRLAAIAIFLALLAPWLLAAPPAMAEEAPSSPERSGISLVLENLGKGVSAVWKTVKGWFVSLGRLFGFARVSGLEEGRECLSTPECADGLLCLNRCPEGLAECDVFAKLCVPASDAFTTSDGRRTELVIQPEYGACGPSGLCAEGTACTRTCPTGAVCATAYRCLAPAAVSGTCRADADCSDACAGRAFLPSGPSSLRAVCAAGACACRLEEADPALDAVPCPASELAKPVLCPPGTWPACTTGACAGDSCPPRRTCLTAPEFGGQCLADADCSAAACAEGSESFCGGDRRCRCRRVVEEIISCEADAECAGLSCPDGSRSFCRDGLCACGLAAGAATEQNQCKTDAECGGTSCPAGYAAACVNGECACQRTLENVPVSCASVRDCEGVSCPAGFEKTCLDGACACLRTRFE